MDEEKKIRSTIYLKPQTKELLRTAAYLLRKSQSEVMNEILEKHLEEVIQAVKKEKHT